LAQSVVAAVMDGIWLEDGTFEPAKGAKAKLKGKSKGKGKDKPAGKDFAWQDDGPAAKRPRKGEDGKGGKAKETPPEDEEEDEEAFFQREWEGKEVCLINLKAADLNGCVGVVKKHMGVEEVMVEGKKKKIRRFMVALEAGKGEKSIKMENLFKIMTGALVKLRGLDTIELNDTIAECGRLDVASMRYDVILSDGRHLKVKPTNVDYIAKYEATKVAGSAEHMERIRTANSLRDRLAVVEEFNYPVPQLLPGTAVEEYCTKFPKSVVIGRSNAANPKGLQILSRDVTMATKVPPGARVIFVSIPRDRVCVAPQLAETRHDELLRLGKLAEKARKLSAPHPVYFLLPGVSARGPPSLLTSAACAWPLYVCLSTDMVVLESDRWQKSSWARLDALMAVWARKPIYILPEKYQPAIELQDASGDTQAASQDVPLSLRPEEPFTIDRPSESAAAAGSVEVMKALIDKAAEAEGGGDAKVLKPSLAVRRLS